MTLTPNSTEAPHLPKASPGRGSAEPGLAEQAIEMPRPHVRRAVLTTDAHRHLPRQVVGLITIPFGLQAFKLAGFVLWPFGRTVVRRPDAGPASVIGNVLWVVLVGWELAIGHVVTAFLMAITIIGIPLALANLKLVPISLLPFGRMVVPLEQARATGATFI